MVFSDADSLSLTGDGGFADDLETAIFNEVLPGVAFKGDSYFSEIPLSLCSHRQDSLVAAGSGIFPHRID
ncbi:MAG: hypothetical protein IJ840_03295 [Bacteroidales bacterium]|nr:hypothetical protein [Bacteroidales bacterium]